jgi:hypothetical protein
MKKMVKVIVATAFGAAAFGVIWAPNVSAAGCALPDETRGSAPQRPQFQAGAYRPASFVLAADRNDGDAGIVGFWHVTFVSEGSQYIPDNTPIDSAYVQWHSDGTEIMNSSRVPATGSFCLGVWKQTGRFTYRLNHIALSWNADGTPQGPASIREEVTLDRSGNKYTGTFTIVQYDVTGTNVLKPTPIVGVITGRRITAD